MDQLKIYLPPPTNWQDFQSLVKQIAQTRYDENKVHDYGRQGQAQFGVDIFAVDREGKTRIGIQCKESKNPLTKKEILDEANKADSFPDGLDVFIIATTAGTDRRIQDVVIDLNKRAVHGFTVKIEFWNDIMDDLNRFRTVINSCYEKYRESFTETDESQHLACLRMAFDRPAFKDDFHCELSCSDFERALVETKRLFRTGITVDSWTSTPITRALPVDLLPAGKYRSFVTRLEKALEGIYKAYLYHKAQIQTHSNHRREQEIGVQLNILRRKLLVSLNERLEEEGLQRINFMYE